VHEPRLCPQTNCGGTQSPVPQVYLLHQIISGGQTGADRAALETARALGIPTGGTAPKYWLTETGNDPSLKDFGLVECEVMGYAVRTDRNVQHADGTVWFGTTDSSGYYCTRTAWRACKKPALENPTATALRKWIITASIYVLNVAGNRASVTPGIGEIVRDTLVEALCQDNL